MKINATVLFALFLGWLFVFTSCKPDTPDNPNDNPSQLCATDSILFAADKDAGLITIVATKSWTISSTASWVTTTATNGTGKTAILVGAEKNEGFARSATLTINAGNSSKTIKIRQNGAELIELTANDVKFRLVFVKGGSFVMGESTNNSPAHTVNLSDFYICETEVTNALWKTLMNALPYDTLSSYVGPNQHLQPLWPVTAVTWNDITTKFFPALKEKTAITFRLPTEAEWEYAAMGGVLSKAYEFSGSNVLDEVGWDSQFSENTKHDVKLKQPNELQLYDMSGNASEWCKDWYETYYTAPTNLTNPQGPTNGIYKVIRGGNYLSEAGILGYNECKVKQRRFTKPTGFQGSWGDTGNPAEPQIFTCKAVGFRFVITAPVR